MDVYLVGGAVRDELLGRPVTERDWVVTGATPQEMLSKGYEQVGKDFPVFLHPKTKEEYALARTERKSGSGYTGFVCYAAPDVTLEQDLIRRDLTVNAIARDKDGNLIDPYHGVKDIESRTLRHVSEAFSEDPLRVFRVARFAARYAYLGFTVADETASLMRSMADSGELAHLTAERVWKETIRALGEMNPEVYFQVLENAGALSLWLKEIKPHLINISNPLKKASLTPGEGDEKWALVCAFLSVDETSSLCQRLKAPNKHSDLALLVSRHCNIYKTADSAGDWLNLFNLCDAWRRPERFEKFLSVMAMIYEKENSYTVAPKLLYALKEANKINASNFIKQGLKGPAIGSAIDKARGEILNSVL
ncbi:CCA tRNA nucleotidyltransferase [Alteromonas sp. NFXS44]